IGEGGKSRKVLEDLTECQISVYGKTIAVIGEVEMMSLARRAVDMLLCGAPHRNVYKWLEKQRRIMGQVTG
ncbi:MAG: RNA-processing protein, partial [Candidatus Nanoarchaeia archaeon]